MSICTNARTSQSHATPLKDRSSVARHPYKSSPESKLQSESRHIGHAARDLPPLQRLLVSESNITRGLKRQSCQVQPRKSPSSEAKYKIRGRTGCTYSGMHAIRYSRTSVVKDTFLFFIPKHSAPQIRKSRVVCIKFTQRDP